MNSIQQYQSKALHQGKVTLSLFDHEVQRQKKMKNFFSSWPLVLLTAFGSSSKSCQQSLSSDVDETLFVSSCQETITPFFEEVNNKDIFYPC